MRKLLLDRLFAQLVEGLEGAFRAPAAQEGEKGSRFEDVGERTARLAGLLPTVARQSRRVLDEVPNEYFVVSPLSSAFPSSLYISRESAEPS